MPSLDYAPAQALCQFLDILRPIVQAPMAGGFVPPALVAAVSNAGGLGSIGAGYMSPEQIRDEIRKVRELTDKPFSVNLFPGGRMTDNPNDHAPMLEVMKSYLAELGIEPPVLPSQLPDPFPEQLEVIISERVPIFSCTFGIPDPEILERLKKAGVKTMGTATTVAEAVAIEQAGMDIVVTQGSEAGAHRGTFLGDFETSMIGSMALVPQVADAVAIPVVAAGGIMDGRGVLAAFALGAAGVQMGTAFLTCAEATIPESYKRALETTPAEQTALTRVYSGRPARGIINQFMRDAAGREDLILPFPFQNNLTRPMRNAASGKGDIRCMSLWAGQAAPLARRIGAGRLVELLMEETVAAYRRLNYSS